jgi:archaellum biogenesis protein FlaJ (TadC family)
MDITLQISVVIIILAIYIYVDKASRNTPELTFIQIIQANSGPLFLGGCVLLGVISQIPKQSMYTTFGEDITMDTPFGHGQIAE